MSNQNLTDVERNQRILAEIAAGKRDSGDAEFDLILITGNGEQKERWAGDSVGTVAQAWIRAQKADPDAERGKKIIRAMRKDYERLGGDLTVTERGVERPKTDEEVARDWIIRSGNLKSKNAVNCEGKYSLEPEIKVGQYLKVPEGNEITDLLWVRACPLPTATITDIPAEPTRPAPQMREISPHYNAGQNTASMGGEWRPGDLGHAQQLLLDSGVDEVYTETGYALKNIAPRFPVSKARDSGSVARTHIMEGEHRSGENASSTADNSYAKKRSDLSGETYWAGTINTQDLGREFVFGHIARYKADGTMVRADHIGKPEFAWGGNYAYQEPFFDTIIPLGNFFNLPVGVLTVAPDQQRVLPSRTGRDGLLTGTPVVPAVSEALYNNVARDQQSKLRSPMATPDDYYGYMFSRTAMKYLATYKHAFDSTPPENTAQRQALAEKLLAAHRDLRELASVREMDHHRIPLQEDLKGYLAYFQAQGVDVAKAERTAENLPRIVGTDMSAELRSKLQSYERLAETRYGHIKPGETNEAYAAAARYAFRGQNAFESAIARADFAALPEPELMRINAEVIDILKKHPNQQGIAEAMADALTRNPNAASAMTNTLRAVYSKPTEFGFKDRDEAAVYLTQFVGAPSDTNVARTDIERLGHSAAVAFFLEDQPHGGVETKEVATQVAERIRTNPALLNDLLGRAANVEYGTDAQGRTDARRYATSILRSFGAELTEFDAVTGSLPPSYFQLAQAVGFKSAEEQKLYNAVLFSTIPGENSRAKHSVQGEQRLQNLTAAAQVGTLKARGEAVDVIGGTEEQKAQDRANILASAQERLAAATAASPTIPEVTEITAIDTGKFRGDGIAYAAEKENVAAVFTGLLRTKEARETGSSGIAMKGLVAFPNLARDSVIVTLINEPTSFNFVIDALRREEKSSNGKYYGKLADTWEEARLHAYNYKVSGNEKDLKKAVAEFADFFKEMDKKKGTRRGDLYQEAWTSALAAVGSDPHASAWMVESVAKDRELVKEVLGTLTRGNISSAHGLDMGQIGPGAMPENYTSRFFPPQADKKAKGKDASSRKGKGNEDASINMASLHAIAAARGVQAIYSDDMQTGADKAQADASKATLAAMGDALVTAKVTSEASNEMSALLSTNPVVYTEARSGKRGVEVLAGMVEAQMVAAKTALPQGYANYTAYAQALAEASLANGLVSVRATATDMQVQLNSGAIAASKDQSDDLGMAAGAAFWWPLLFLPIPGKGKPGDPGTNLGEVGGCCIIVRPDQPLQPSPVGVLTNIARTVAGPGV